MLLKLLPILIVIWSFGSFLDGGIFPYSYYSSTPIIDLFILSWIFRTAMAFLGTALILDWRPLERPVGPALLATLCGLPLISLEMIMRGMVPGGERTTLLKTITYWPAVWLSHVVTQHPIQQTLVFAITSLLLGALLFELPRQLLHAYVCAVGGQKLEAIDRLAKFVTAKLISGS